MIDQLKKEMSDSMSSALDSLKYQLSKVRTGRASASVLDGVKVDYYGTMTAVNQVGQISTPEARLLQIQPFDRNMIAAIEKAILTANLGLTPSNDGNLIRIPFPALTEERRKEQERRYETKHHYWWSIKYRHAYLGGRIPPAFYDQQTLIPQWMRFNSWKKFLKFVLLKERRGHW